MKTAHVHPATCNLAQWLTRHGSPTIYRCFALPQLLYRWRYQSGKFSIPPCISTVRQSKYSLTAYCRRSYEFSKYHAVPRYTRKCNFHILPKENYDLYLANLRDNHRWWTALHANLLYRTAPKSENWYGMCREKFVYAPKESCFHGAYFHDADSYLIILFKLYLFCFQIGRKM